MAKAKQENMEILNKFRERKSSGEFYASGEYNTGSYTPTGLAGFDFELRGGITLGRYVEIFGDSQSGKTTLAIHIARKIVEQVGGRCLFIDVEHTYPEHLHFEGTDVYESTSGEDACEALRDGILAGYPVIILDSVGALNPLHTQNSDADNNSIGKRAKLVTTMFGMTSDIVAKYGCTILLVNHKKEAIGGYQGEFYTAGGKMMEYMTNLRLNLTALGKANYKLDSETGSVIFKPTRVRVHKNKRGPAVSEYWDIYMDHKGRFNEEIDFVLFAVKMGIVKQAGAHFKYGDKSLGAGVIQVARQLRDMPEYTIMKQHLADVVELTRRYSDVLLLDDIPGYNSAVEKYNKKWNAEVPTYLIK